MELTYFTWYAVMTRSGGWGAQAMSQAVDAATLASLEGLLQFADARKKAKFGNGVEHVPNGSSVSTTLAVQ